MQKGDDRIAMKRQGGAALIVVLGIVAISTMIGLASMQSSQIDEKMAGNYKLATRTALFTERAATALIPEIRTGASAVALPSNSDMGQDGFQSFAAKTKEEGGKSCLIEASGDMTAAACYIEVPEGEEFQDRKAGDYIVAWSAISRGSKPFVGQPLIIEVDGGLPGGAFDSVLLGCEGVNVSGGGSIDSYDSRDGSYGGENQGFSNAKIQSNAPEGDIVLSTGQPFYGDVVSSGGIEVGNSGTIYGNLKANGDIVVRSGGADIRGNIASHQAVRLTSGTITGNVEANTEIVTGSWSSSIEGNATAPVVRTTTNRDVEEQVGGNIERSSPNVGEVATSSCDSFITSGGATISDLTDALSSYTSSGSLSIGGGNQTYTLTPYGLQVPADSNNNSVPNPERYQVTRDVMIDGVFPEPTNVLVLDSFSLGGSANFFVGGGDMTLYVKGDINIGGGATFSVAEGSSLKIVTDGRFSLPSGLDVASDSPTDEEGNPILSLYSTYDDGGASAWNAGVNITGSSAFKGTIFAPYSTVNVAGSGGLYGAVKGRRVEVSGGAGIHYDEALMESTVGTGAESAGGRGGISFTWL